MKKILSMLTCTLVLFMVLNISCAMAAEPEANVVIASGDLYEHNHDMEGSWMLDSAGTLHFSGSGYLDFFGDPPWVECEISILAAEVGEGFTGLGNMVFSWMSELRSVTLPASMVEIVDDAFDGCRSDLTIIAPEGSYAREWVEECGMFSEAEELTLDGVVYRLLSNRAVVIGYEGEAANVVIPAQVNGLPVTKIKNGAFNNRESLTGISLPDSLISIDSDAFSWSGLTSIVIPEQVSDIKSGTFANCVGLTSVTLPEHLTRIDSWAFMGCTSLTSIAIPESVTSVGEYAFSACTGLTSIVIPEGVTSVGEYAFSDCTSLASVTLPASLTSIADSAFDSCGSELTIYAPAGSYAAGWAEENGFRLMAGELIASGALDSAGWSIDREGQLTILGEGALDFDGETPWYAYRNYIRTAVIGEGITRVGNFTLAMCDSLTGVSLPASATSIGNNAFLNCASLTSVTIPEGVTEIGDWAFNRCTGLREIALPEGVTTIGMYAFADCEGLTSVTLPASVKEIGENAFANCGSALAIHAPEGSYAYSWAEAHDLLPKPETVSENGIVYELFNGEATVKGYEGVIADVVIPAEVNDVPVTKIGNEAFKSCASLTGIVIPEGVTNIGWGAFEGCTGLKSVTIPEGVTSIHDCTFEGCTSLREIVIPEGVTEINIWAFANCASLTSVTLPASVTLIESDAFENCNSALVITAPEGSFAASWASEHGYTVATTHVPAITPAVPATHVTTGLTEGTHCAVCGAILLAQEITPVVEVEKLVLPADLVTIGEEAFAGDGIACVVLPEGCTEIGDSAFRDCAQLRFAEIPASVTHIASSAFDGCDTLIIVTVSGSEAERFAKEHEITCVLKG